jgi:chromosome partitioning protein
VARIIAVALSKGGTGKTTSAVNLAHGLTRRGLRVLLVDTDTQGQCAFLLGVKPSAGVPELLAGEVKPEEALTQAREKLFLLAGGRQLAGAKRVIDRQEFGGERLLAEVLNPLVGRFDYVLLDCAPGWDALNVNALFASQEVLCPVSMEVLALQGLGEFVKSVEAIRRYKPDLRLAYVLPTFVDRRVRKTEDVLGQLRTHFKDRVCSPIRYSVKLSQAAGHGQTIFEYAPDSVGAEDYTTLVQRVMNGKA